jgi:hypothetical protein
MFEGIGKLLRTLVTYSRWPLMFKGNEFLFWGKSHSWGECCVSSSGSNKARIEDWGLEADIYARV